MSGEIKRPGKYTHTNSNLPIVDAINVDGGYYPINSISLRNTIPIAKRSNLIEIPNVGLFRYTGSDFEDVNWINTAKWQNITDELSNKASKNGDQNETFKAAQGIANEDVVTLGQMQTALANANANLVPQGNWDATTNTPDISATTTTGFYWIVSVDGTTNIGGINDWKVNDKVIKTAVGWAKENNKESVVSVAGKKGVVVLTKADVGLNLVDNTSDADKPISNTTQQALNDKQETLVNQQNIKSINNKNIVGGGNIDITKTDINLDQVDNTADIDKPISTAVQLALDEKLGSLEIDDAFYFDENNVLRPNLTNFSDSYLFNKSQPILPLSFEPVAIDKVFVDGDLFDTINYDYKNTHDLEILNNVKNGCKIDVYYNHFVDAIYNDTRYDYIEGEATNIISCIDAMDVIFIVDFTGSMGATIDTVKNNILTILNTIETESNNNFRISVVIFDEITNSSSPNYESTSIYTNLKASQKRVIAGTDSNNIYITNVIEFTSDKTSVTNLISELNTVNFPLGNGESAPEPSDIAISEIIENSFAGTFRTEANKSIILFTDASASGLDDANSALDTAELNRLKSILINKGITFSVMFNDSVVNIDYQNMAIETQGKYVSDFSSTTEITTAIEQICESI